MEKSRRTPGKYFRIYSSCIGVKVWKACEATFPSLFQQLTLLDQDCGAVFTSHPENFREALLSQEKPYCYLFYPI